MVKEIITANLTTVPCTTYTYTSPTHWSHDGICQLVERHWPMSKPEISLRWGSGGVNKDATEKEIAEAMSQAFRMASERITEIEGRLNKQERNNEQTV